MQSSLKRKRTKKSNGGAQTSTLTLRRFTPHCTTTAPTTVSVDTGGRLPPTVAINARPLHFSSSLTMPGVRDNTSMNKTYDFPELQSHTGCDITCSVELSSGIRMICVGRHELN